MTSTMAEALAASLPAPQVGPAVPLPTAAESIPASKSKLVDIEAAIPLRQVQLNGLVVSKIIKHGQDVRASQATGSLLGLDLDGTLEVYNSFPMPTLSSFAGENDEDKAGRPARYQAAMLRSLKDIQQDDTLVGCYVTTTLGMHITPNILDVLQSQAEKTKIRHGGVIIVHDATQTARGDAGFRAFRLAPNYVEASKKGRFASQELAASGLTTSTLLEELPIVVKNSSLLDSYLEALRSPANGTKPEVEPSFRVLDLQGAQAIETNLEEIGEKMDEYKNEEANVAYMIRHIAREKARAEAYVMKRKEDSAARVAQGLAPLPEEDVSRLFKISNEPSRLESLVLLGQLEGLARNLGRNADVVEIDG